MKKKVISLMLASAMVFSLAACGGKSQESSSQAGGVSSSSSEASSAESQEPEPTPDNSRWDGAYMGADDFRAYIGNDLEQMVADIQDQLTADQKTAVDAAKAAGLEAIGMAGTVAEVKAAYEDAFKAILDCIPLADGLLSYNGGSYDERTDMLGILETYAIRNGITGVTLYESGSYVLYNPRVTVGTETYIVGYGFGSLSEGAITADLDYETNPDWKRYWHSLNAQDPGTLNYLNDKGSEVGDFYGYVSTGYYETFMNATKDGYEWVPSLAMEKPVALNDDGSGSATKWRFQIRTGKEGLKYTTGSKIASRAAFNNREVALEDYLTPYKLLLTQTNQYYRGSEMANGKTGAIKGVKEFYDGTANGFSQDLWDKVGIKAYEENGKSYLEIEYEEPLNRFYAMYYIASNLYMPVPQDFLDLVTVQNYLGFNKNATETPVDNSLSLGAYYLETYNQDQEVVYKKNPNYVFADTKYSIEGVHIRILPAIKDDKMASLNEFLAGHTDTAGVPKDVLDQYKNDPRARQTTGGTVFKLNINAADAETWEYLFGENGTVAQNAKADYWDLKPVLGNMHFIQGLRYSIDRLTYANARGATPTANYLSSAYMSNPEDGVSYSKTEAHAKAIASQLAETDGYGYSLELAREYFRLAMTELEAAGAYKPGTKEAPAKIDLEIAWMYPTDEEDSHNEIKACIEKAFNDESVSGGKYQLSVNFWVGNEWSDVYYKKMLAGQFDLGMGSISGNSLDPLSFMNVLSADQGISGGFTLNWGVNTNGPDEYPLVFDGKRFSYDAFFRAATTQAIVVGGKNSAPINFNYEKIVKNDDGTYTGALEMTATLPDKTKLTVTSVVCCNYERYRNGDKEYDESEVEFTAEDKGNGVTRITFTVPADLAKDYATGSGTSAEPTGITGFDFYYDYELGGKESKGNTHSVDDNFVVE